MLRRLGDAAVLFDPCTWQTHLLPPAAAVIVEVIVEHSSDGVPSLASAAQAIRDELELDPHSPEIRALLRTLAEIGMLRE
ncbi:MAG TPA: HPr-rel-A system PqqD family peptide chaperone [Rhodocyclaceae bacterium]|nr:HPr-rel-A system PqqD family peptide chaperone [Rhodocyclaceae bacterium]